MDCYLCGSERYIEILNKQDVCIWTNASDEAMNKKRMYKCVINQCRDCGHVYQPINEGLRNILNEIYLSDSAQVSTPPGKGNWGLERAKVFLDKIDFKNYKSAIELGCADGYILKCLKNKGFKKLVGIDPSISKTEESDGILFLKNFADEKLKLPQKYDLIFSSGVFEHVKKVNGLINFCKNNLSENGEVFFSVPNAQAQLENGDPALFLHQHIHYYTERALTYLLWKNGFKIESLTSSKGGLDVTAKVKKSNIETLPEIVFYDDYAKKLEKVLVKIETILQKNNVIVHGANNSLNNILGWLNKNFNFILVDNDSTKRGKKYFGRTVLSVEDIKLRNYSAILIIPAFFYETIKQQYLEKGFEGKIENVLLNKNIDLSL